MTTEREKRENCTEMHGRWAPWGRVSPVAAREREKIADVRSSCNVSRHDLWRHSYIIHPLSTTDSTQLVVPKSIYCNISQTMYNWLQRLCDSGTVLLLGGGVAQW